MANPKNTADLAELKEKLAGANSVVLTEYRGLTVSQLQELRNDLGFDVEYSVAKNTLFKIAAKEAGIEGLDDLLTGPTAIAFIKGEAVDAAKVITKFADDNKALIIKGGYMDGNALSADQVEAIAKLDNRETTLAKLAGAMKGSMAKAAALQRSCNQGCTHRRSPAGQEGSRSLSRHKRRTITTPCARHKSRAAYTQHRKDLPSWLSSPRTSSLKLSRK